MYKKILVAFDQSSQGESVFNVSLDLAKTSGASLMLLHILSKDSQNRHVSDVPLVVSGTPQLVATDRQQLKQFEHDSLETLERYVQKAQAENVETKFMQIDGQPGKMICSFAQEWGADLIVVGRRGYSAAEEMFLGSVSSYVVHWSHCSVHIVQV